MHDKCESSALCHLCDGKRLYKNRREEFARKMEVREQNKQAEKQAAFRVHKAEKKRGMAFEKVVEKKWNDAYKKKVEGAPMFKGATKKTKIQKPRLGVELETIETEEEPIKEASPQTIALSTFQKPKAIQNQPVVDAKRQPNSGALWASKGDIKTQEYLLECKGVTC